MEQEKKDLVIFRKYSSNLQLLGKLNIIGGFLKDTYICPLCMKGYDIEKLDDELTLEHNPPNSVGGKANTLTCKRCNNTLGSKIDSHFHENLRMENKMTLRVGEELPVIIKTSGKASRGTIKRREDNSLVVSHEYKNNNPVELDANIEPMKSGDEVLMNYRSKFKIVKDNVEYAILKIAYLLMFEKLGYALIFNPIYDKIREQLQNIEKRTYTDSFYILAPNDKNLDGLYLVINPGFECLLVAFSVKVDELEKQYWVFLTLPILGLEEVISNMRQWLKEKKSLTVESLNEKDYLTNAEEITKLWEWINPRKATYKHDFLSGE